VSPHRPATVLITIPNFLTAGSGPVVVDLAERLDRARFTPVVGVRARAHNARERRLEDAGVEIIEVDLRVAARPVPTLPLRARRAGSTLRRRGIDLVHSFDYSDDYTEALVARAAGAAYVSTKKNASWGSRAWFLRSALSHRIVAFDEDMLGRFFSHPLLRGRVRLIPPGVDVDHFADLPDRAASRRVLGVPDDAVVVGCVANILRLKNQVLLVRALPSDARVHLILAGPVRDEGYRAEIESTAAERGVADRVHLVGPMDDVRPVLAVSDVFGFVSRSEGSPVSVVEAMSAGLPTLGSTIPGMVTLLEGADAAILVDPDDVAGATAALAALCRDADRRREMGSRAAAVARTRRSVDLAVARTEALYLELLRTR
jgi:glycosyltransferase involved in cell wall biosynthesis